MELNPVRARLAAVAWEWPWSSARAHTEPGALDAVLSCHWTEYLGRWDHTEWKEILAAVLPEGECQAVRRATRTGQPLGEREFVVALERQAGRMLRVRERGRPRREPQSPEERARQGCLFAANAE